MAVAFFGRDYQLFTNPRFALPTLFRCVVGDFDFASMETAGRLFAALFFCSFMLLVVLIMLSMLIAIIMDEYLEVKERSASAQSLWSTCWQMAKRKYEILRGRRVCLWKVVAYLREDIETNSQRS